MSSHNVFLNIDTTNDTFRMNKFFDRLAKNFG